MGFSRQPELSRNPEREPAWPRRAKSYSLARVIALIFAPLLVILSAALMFSALQNVRASQRSVERSYETREHLMRAFSLLQDAETAQRGFVITGRDNFLEPYNHAIRDIPGQLATLDSELGGDARQARRLRTLRSHIDDKLKLMAETIEVRRRAGPDAAAAEVASERGKILMDSIRIATDEMIKAESDSLSARLEHAQAAVGRVQLIARILAVLLLSSLIYAAYLIRQYAATSERLLAQNQQQTARLAAIFDSTLDAMLTLNPSGSIETINLPAERMFGWTEGELERRDISVLVDLAPGEGLFLERLSLDDEANVSELTARRKDGSTFDVEISVGSMSQHDGVHLVAAIRDISDRRAAERVKEEFVSTVSHELRTPLTSIAGALGLLESGAVGEMPEKATRLIYIARASSERLVRLINDLLDVEKISTGQVQFDLQRLDLRVAAARAVEGLTAFATERGVSIHLDTPGESLLVRGDMDRLIQVFTNLLSNAVKFSPDGETVDIVLRSDAGRIRALVRDRGPGVPESFRASIFGKFAQADSSSAGAKGGAGLGLVISKGIVERHHGRIRLAADTGLGAVFEVELPRIARGSPSTDSRPRLLLCEDDPHAAGMLASCLDQDGFATDQVSSIAAAEQALDGRCYLALVLDLNLPDGDGLSLIQRLRAEPRHARMPIIVVTGESPEGQALSGGLSIADWLQKPVDPKRLSQSIRAALPGRTDLRILHVDDDQDLAEVVASALADAGKVFTAGSLAQGRTKLASDRFDLVVLDIGLPDGSGLDLLVDIGAANPRPPVIVYSGQELEPGLLGRVDAVLTKSRTSFETLLDTVRRVTDRGPK